MPSERAKSPVRAKQDDEARRLTYRIRLSPSTYQRLRAYAVASGHGTRWAIALESMLELAIPVLKGRKITGKPPVYKKKRSENESHSAKLMPDIVVQIKMLALTHGYTHDSDLIEEIIEDFLNDLSK